MLIIFVLLFLVLLKFRAISFSKNDILQLRSFTDLLNGRLIKTFLYTLSANDLSRHPDGPHHGKIRFCCLRKTKAEISLRIRAE